MSDLIDCTHCEGAAYFAGMTADRNGDQAVHACAICEGSGEIKRPPNCWECDGAGVLVCDVDPSDRGPCSTCKGRGFEPPRLPSW